MNPFLIGLFIYVFTLPLMAQHCPYDGTYIVLLKATSHSDRWPDFYLHEMYNEQVEKCTYSDKLIHRLFRTEKDIMDEMRLHPNYYIWKHLISDLYNDYNFLAGCQVVFLTMADKSCMIKSEGMNYLFQQRSFQITWKYNGINDSIQVAPSQVYPLCTVAGLWSRIQAITIRLD